jgi:hypothetical protein
MVRQAAQLAPLLAATDTEPALAGWRSRSSPNRMWSGFTKRDIHRRKSPSRSALPGTQWPSSSTPREHGSGSPGHLSKVSRDLPKPAEAVAHSRAICDYADAKLSIARGPLR